VSQKRIEEREREKINSNILIPVENRFVEDHLHTGNTQLATAMTMQEKFLRVRKRDEKKKKKQAPTYRKNRKTN
jgi:hypothetical protein